MKPRQQVPLGAVPWSRLGGPGAILLIGLLLGFLVVTRGCGPAQGPGVSQERYAVLAGTLYAGGESLAVVRQHLDALGPVDQPAFLMRIADRLASSSDRGKQRQGEELRQLAQALSQSAAGVEIPAVVTASALSAAATPQPTPSPDSAAPVGPPMGIVKSPQGEGVRLRAEASTTAAPLALIRSGTRVEILDVVQGQEVDKDEKRWYKVRSGQTTGFIYFNLLTPAD
jgi:hypothetical protein